MTDQKILEDWEELQGIIGWLVTDGKTASLDMKNHFLIKFNRLIVRHELSPVLSYKEILSFMKIRAAAARARLEAAGQKWESKN